MKRLANSKQTLQTFQILNTLVLRRQRSGLPGSRATPSGYGGLVQKRSRVLIILINVPLLLTVWTTSGCSRPQTTTSLPDGESLYTTYCISCHGKDGRNDRNGANPVMRLADANTLSDKTWETLVLHGRGQMPAFNDRLSTEELGALRTYIRGLTHTAQADTSGK